eukprot:g5370.t1
MDVELPEIPVKLISVFRDANDEIRVKEDTLREVLSRFRSYSSTVGTQVLEVLRNEFVEEVTTLRNRMADAQSQLSKDFQASFASKEALKDLEDLRAMMQG